MDHREDNRRPDVAGGAIAAGIIIGTVLLTLMSWPMDGRGTRTGPERPSLIPTRTIEEMVLNQVLTTRKRITVYEQPERSVLLPMLWKNPEPGGSLAAGERVRITRIGETSRFGERTVWMEAQPAGRRVRVWIPLGAPPLTAMTNLETKWTREEAMTNGRSTDS